MTTIAIPRQTTHRGRGDLPWRRLEDFHTALSTRRADGSPNPDAVVTRRQYLLDARFGVLFEGPYDLLQRVAAKVQDPVWGVWLGRKSCIPAMPLYVELAASQETAWKAILRRCCLDDAMPIGAFTAVAEVVRFDDGTDSLGDQPVSFGDRSTSGPDKRRFTNRRIAVKPGSGPT
jgi:CRISPR system Cascade subunit CasD